MNPIAVLSEYLSGTLVADSSAALQVGGFAAQRARRFFELREAFGVTGYADREEAERMILATLAPVLHKGRAQSG